MTALRDAQWHLVRRNAKVWGSVGYKNPILTEIYAELTLPGDGLGTSFVEIVPLLKPVGLNAVELSHIRNFNIETRNGDDPKVTKEHIPRLRVWNDNKSQLAQLSKNQIVINLVGKYAGWSAFRTLFDGVLGVV
ncbi:MAG: TIGR04255 family protein, partial [Bdellovibrionales bacterium]|nr:TIGR04255 family protein [Bdellovibrionales bacterium]